MYEDSTFILKEDILQNTRNRWYQWMPAGAFLVGQHSTDVGEGSIFLPIFEKLLTFSEFGWRQSSSPLETETKNAHCPGCQPHPCSNSEALDLNSKGGAKMTGSRDFFFIISALLNAETNLQWFHQQQQYQFAGTAMTEAQIAASWSQAQQCKYFQLCIPHSKMAACSSLFCVMIWAVGQLAQAPFGPDFPVILLTIEDPVSKFLFCLNHPDQFLSENYPDNS